VGKRERERERERARCRKTRRESNECLKSPLPPFPYCSSANILTAAIKCSRSTNQIFKNQFNSKSLFLTMSAGLARLVASLGSASFTFETCLLLFSIVYPQFVVARPAVSVIVNPPPAATTTTTTAATTTTTTNVTTTTPKSSNPGRNLIKT